MIEAIAIFLAIVLPGIAGALCVIYYLKKHGYGERP